MKRRDWDGDPVSSAASGKGDSERSHIEVVHPRCDASDGAMRSSACPRCCVLPGMGLSVPQKGKGQRRQHVRMCTGRPPPAQPGFQTTSTAALRQQVGFWPLLPTTLPPAQKCKLPALPLLWLFLTRFLPGRPAGPSDAGLRGAPSCGWQSAGALARAEQRDQGNPGPTANNLSDVWESFLLQSESGSKSPGTSTSMIALHTSGVCYCMNIFAAAYSLIGN